MLAGMKHEAPAPILEQLRRGHPWCWVVCERCMHRKAVAFAPLIILWRAGGLKRSASAIGAPREVWGEGSCLAAPELGRHGPWVGTVSRVIVAKRLARSMHDGERICTQLSGHGRSIRPAGSV